jgi:hypothetical protein
MRVVRAGVVGLVAGLAATALVACGSPESPSGSDEPERTDFPDDVSVFIDQARTQRKGREVFIRLHNDGDQMIDVRHAEIRSDRFAAASWDGDETFQNEIDLEFELPTGSCGTGSDATVELTYRMAGEDGWRISEVTAVDRYDAIALVLDHDCAQQTLLEAAELEVGEPQVVGEGRESVFRVPVTMTPTGDRDDVRFGGFGSTPLFRSTGEWADPGPDVPGPDVPLTGSAPIEVALQIKPAMCDPHALADDKVGTLFDTFVLADGLPPEASFYLPVPPETRAAMFTFFLDYCGLSD